MTSPGNTARPRARKTGRSGQLTVDLADHAGSVLCRLLMDHPEVVDIEVLGQAELVEGTICYSLGVFLPDGRELYVDVEEAPPRAAAAQPGSEGPWHPK